MRIESARVVREPTTITHEKPGGRLAALASVIASVRGGAIECFGSADLLLRDERGEKSRIMQADQTAHLHPGRSTISGDTLELGRDTVPNVVLEVDHTTDARKGKLACYETWGFPEVWVDVPEADRTLTKNRPTGLKPGLTIHLLKDGAYHPASESLAFPGWTAAEIHQALNAAWTSREIRQRCADKRCRPPCRALWGFLP